jgi:hypothetical protein
MASLWLFRLQGIQVTEFQTNKRNADVISAMKDSLSIPQTVSPCANPASTSVSFVKSKRSGLETT